MALQILQGLSPADEVRQSAGTDFAKMLGTGLQSLAQHKMQQLQQAKTSMGLQTLPGINPEQAQLMAQLPPDILKYVIKGMTSGASQEKEQKRQDAIRKHYEPKLKMLMGKETLLNSLDENIQKGGPNFLTRGINKRLGEFAISDEMQALGGDAKELLNLEIAEQRQAGGGIVTKQLMNIIEDAKLGLHLPQKEFKRRLDRKLAATRAEKERVLKTYPFLAENLEMQDQGSQKAPQEGLSGQQEEAQQTGQQDIQKQINTMFSDGGNKVTEKMLTTDVGPGFQIGNEAYVWDKIKKRYVKVPRK